MKIETVLLLKSLFSDFLDKVPACDVLLLNTTTSVWREELLALRDQPHSNPLVLICMLVNHPEEPARIDALFMACKPEEINDEYLQEISSYINDEKHGTTILDFLDKKWKIDPSNHVLTIWLTTRADADANYTVIADRAIAPAYQKHHLMKLVSLKLVEQLEEIYGSEHRLISFPIHPATYLFFNPWDKSLRSYEPGAMEDVYCGTVLKSHGKRPQISISIDYEKLIFTSIFTKYVPPKKTYPLMITGLPAPLLLK
jgi:hypothetical protein